MLLGKSKREEKFSKIFFVTYLKIKRPLNRKFYKFFFRFSIDCWFLSINYIANLFQSVFVNSKFKSQAVSSKNRLVRMIHKHIDIAAAFVDINFRYVMNENKFCYEEFHNNKWNVNNYEL